MKLQCVFVVPLIVLAVCASVRGQITWERVAGEGDAAPSGGTFDLIQTPWLGNDGTVAFRARVTGSPYGTQWGTFRATESGGAWSLATLFLGAEPIPELGNSTVSTIRDPEGNNLGEVFCQGSIKAPADTLFHEFIGMADAAGTRSVLLESGTVLPDGGESITAFRDLYPVVNRAGHVGTDINVSDGVDPHDILLRRNPDGTLTRVAERGMHGLLPSVGSAYNFSIGGINDAGHTAFEVGRWATENEVAHDIYLADASGIHWLCSAGDPMPVGGAGTVSSMTPPRLSNQGVVASKFRTESGDNAIVVGQLGSLATIAEAGLPLTSEPRDFTNSIDVPHMGENGDVLFDDSAGLFLWSTLGGLEHIGRSDTAIPGFDPLLRHRYTAEAINDDGLAIAKIELRTADDTVHVADVLCAFDDGQVIRLLAEGDLLDGQVVSWFTVSDSSLNDSDQLAVNLGWTSGDSAVYRITVPEPATAGLVTIALSAMLAGRRRRRRRTARIDRG